MDTQTKMCCGTCRFGVKIGGKRLPRYIGCHRFPPAGEMDSPLDRYGASKFPLLELNAFCWEWSAKVVGENLPEGNYLADEYD